YILDLAYLDDAGLFNGTEVEGTEVFHEPTLNALMSMGKKAWKETRLVISKLLRQEADNLRDNNDLNNMALIPMNEVEMQLPVDIGD
ncbi:MAG TPA: fumarylacetoacetase, partial [Candidatus Poseidoniia archaeon]|nr:fumarylacetoacetase [Candidatus Poseidoniia archaeon]